MKEVQSIFSEKNTDDKRMHFLRFKKLTENAFLKTQICAKYMESILQLWSRICDRQGEFLALWKSKIVVMLALYTAWDT